MFFVLTCLWKNLKKKLKQSMNDKNSFFFLRTKKL